MALSAGWGESLLQVAQLALLTLIAGGAVALMIRLSGGDGGGRASGRLVGYPPQFYPAAELVREGPLAQLAAIQQRLVLLHAQLPPGSEMALWLAPFLVELRTVMDRAYDVAVITRLYGRPAALERLATEVARLEQQVAEHVTGWLMAPSETGGEGLEVQLMLLRLCVDELARSRATAMGEA